MDFVFFSPLQPFEVAKDKKKNWKNLKKKEIHKSHPLNPLFEHKILKISFEKMY